MYHDLTKGSISRSLLLFALPMMAGNLLQQFYNIADTLIVGRVLGKNALAAVGSSYTLMTFLTSIFLGLSMGSGALFSIYRGKGDERALKSSIAHACGLILAVTLVLNAVVYIFIDPILSFLRVPEEVWGGMREYLLIIFAGLLATSLYNFFSCLLRALGNSTVPLVFLAVSAILNIAWDLLFVAVFHWGIAGAAWATLIAQAISALLSFLVLYRKLSRIQCGLYRRFDGEMLANMTRVAIPTIIQQSMVSIGMLLIQAAVNRFGSVFIAGYTAACKIDGMAIVPMVNAGNAVSTFVAQNMGAGKPERAKKGYHIGLIMAVSIGLVIGIFLFFFGDVCVGAFMNAATDGESIALGAQYIAVVSMFYFVMGAIRLLQYFEVPEI